jgi:hypothetical protein
LEVVQHPQHKTLNITHHTAITGRIISDNDLPLNLQQHSDELGEQVQTWRGRSQKFSFGVIQNIEKEMELTTL